MTRQIPKAEFAILVKQIWNTIKGLEGKSARQVKDDLLEAMIDQEILAEDRGAGGTNPLDYWGKGYIPADRRVIDFLAEVGVRQGQLPASWLDRFLGAAGYLPAHRRELIRAFYGEPAPARARRPVTLPAQQGNFLGRRQELEWVCEALHSNWTVCLVVGIAGTGKTTLALEVAHACNGQGRAAAQDLNWPRYPAIIWTSADGNAALNLNSWLDSIAYSLGYSGVAEKPFHEKRTRVTDLLADQSTLLILDNFETITDPGIADFIVQLPSNVKVLLTSREEDRLSVATFRRYPPARIQLGGLLEDEALLLVRQEAQQLADRRQGAGRMRLAVVAQADDDALRPLVATTEGNPKALALAVGLIANSATPLSTLVQDLHAAADSVADLLGYFCQWSWDRCSADARALWQALPFFVTPARREALAAAAGLHGRYFHDAVEQLRGRALLDVEDGPDGDPRYRAHPLVRAFALARVRAADADAAAARERWLAWYEAYLAEHNQENWAGLAALDSEQANIAAALTWAVDHQHPAAPRLVRHFWPFLYARGQWRQCETWTRQALLLATAPQDTALRLWLSAHLGRLLLWQGHRPDAWAHLKEVEAEIEQRNQPHLVHETRVHYFLGQVSLWDGAIDQAERYFTAYLASSEQRADRVSALSARQSLAQVALGREQWADAAHWYQQALQEARDLGRERVEAYCSYGMGLVELHRDHPTEAADWLRLSGALALAGQEISLQADVLFAQARLARCQAQPLAALALADQARAFYQRLEAHVDLDNIDTFRADLEHDTLQGLCAVQGSRVLDDRRQTIDDRR